LRKPKTKKLKHPAVSFIVSSGDNFDNETAGSFNFFSLQLIQDIFLTGANESPPQVSIEV
jgi:hypothetical protein